MKIKLFAYLILTLSGLSIHAQTISLNPNNGNRGQSYKPFSIIGKETHFSQSANTITFLKQGASISAIFLTSIVVVNDTLITGLIYIGSNVPIGFYDVQVKNNEDTIILTNGFTINSSSILSITPNSAMKGETVKVTITTSNYNFSYDQIYFYEEGSSFYNEVEFIRGPVPEPFINDSVKQINVKIANFANPGLYTLRINDSLILKNAFTVKALTSSTTPIINVTPYTGKQGETLKISLTCKNTYFRNNPLQLGVFFSKEGSNTVDPNVTVTEAHITSETTIDATVVIAPNAPLGLYDISYSYVYKNSQIDYTSYESKRIRAFTVNSGTTGIKNINTLSTKVYPNPTDKLLNIESKEDIEEISIYDIVGKEIHSQTIEKESLNYQLNLSELLIPKGIYFIKIRSNHASSTQKIILE